MNRAMLTSVCALFAIACSSIQPNPQTDPRVQFAKTEPEEARKYVLLNPTTLFETESMYGTLEARIVGILASLPRRLPECAGLNEYRDEMLDKQREFRLGLLATLERLRSAAKDGGGIYQYQRIDGQQKEYGLLALRSGHVITKEIIIIEEVGDNPSHGDLP